MAEFKFDMEENREKIQTFKAFIAGNKERRGALMPVLQEAQTLFGYLPKEIMELVSKELMIPIAEIFGVATFYSQFTFIPKGRHDINVCLGTACYVKGAEGILHAFEEELGIKAGETTPDLQFSITPTRCLGACSIAPVAAIDGEQFGHLTKSSVKELVARYR